MIVPAFAMVPLLVISTAFAPHCPLEPDRAAIKRCGAHCRPGRRSVNVLVEPLARSPACHLPAAAMDTCTITAAVDQPDKPECSAESATAEVCNPIAAQCARDEMT